MYATYQKLRDERNLTDYAVAKDLGIGRSTFSEWKKGDYTPKYEKLKKIAEYFGVTVEYLESDGNPGPSMDMANKSLVDLLRDDDLLSALKVYNKMPPAKKKQVVEIIHLLGSENE